MDKRIVVLVIGVGRIVVGVVFLVVFVCMVCVWVGFDACMLVVRMMAISVGVCDLLLGFGLVCVLQCEEGVVDWFWYGVVADVVDGLGALRDFRSLFLIGKVILSVVIVAAAVGVVLVSVD